MAVGGKLRSIYGRVLSHRRPQQKMAQNFHPLAEKNDGRTFVFPLRWQVYAECRPLRKRFLISTTWLFDYSLPKYEPPSPLRPLLPTPGLLKPQACGATGYYIAWTIHSSLACQDPYQKMQSNEGNGRSRTTLRTCRVPAVISISQLKRRTRGEQHSHHRQTASSADDAGNSFMEATLVWVFSFIL